MGKKKWLTVVLIFAVLLTYLPINMNTAQGATPTTTQLRQMFDSIDRRTNGGNWYKNNNNESNVLSWNQSYLMASYIVMYEATGDTYYLDRFIDHGDSVLRTRDSVRGVTDWRGLSTPAWRTGGPHYNLNGQILNNQYYIMGVNTGMVTYSFAEFAALVYNDPSLSQYKGKADVYLKAAKDAVAVHDYEWVDKGSTGYYVFKKGAPYWTDGANLPHNQYLTLARTQLAIYQATGESFYRNRVEKMARLFKSHLTVDAKTGAYIWHYQWGSGLNGWTSSDNLSTNRPSYGGYKRYEDVSHGAIDVDFAYKAYKAGIVFTEQDMVRFGRTIEHHMILPNGKISTFVNGGVEARFQIMMAHWLRISDYTPSLYPMSEKLILSLTGAGGSGMLAIAMTNLAANGGGVVHQPKNPVDNPPVIEEPSQPDIPVDGKEYLVNGTFTQNRIGWGGNLGTIRTETNGNKYLSNGYNWQVHQDLNLEPGQYQLSANTRKMNATTEARIVVRYTDAQGKTSFENFLHSHRTAGWEGMEGEITVPQGTVGVRLYLLTNGGNGEHGFDNVSLRGPEVEEVVDITPPKVTIIPPTADGLVKGTVELKATAVDNEQVLDVTFEHQQGEGNGTSLPAEHAGGDHWIALWNTTDLEDGVYTIKATAVDGAGNQGASEKITVVVDNTPPRITLISSPSLTIIGNGQEQVTINYNLSEKATVNLKIVDEGGNTVAHPHNNQTGDPGDHSAVWGQTAVPGSYGFEITAVDSAGNQGSPVTGTIQVKAPQPVPKPKDGEQVTNGGFEQNRSGWSGNLGTIRTEGNGNKYLSNGYNWQVHQDLNLEPGQYQLSANTRKMNATTEARIVVRYTDAQGKTSFENFLHSHRTAGWEGMEGEITVPQGTVGVRLYLLTNGGNGEHGFDNVSVKVPVVKPEQVTNGTFTQNRIGWGGNLGTIRTETNGNKYLSNGYNWQVHQDLNLEPGQYQLSANTRKMNATTEARIVVRYTDAQGKTSFENFLHSHRTAGWEGMEGEITVPRGTVGVRLYLLTNGGNGEHGFDNVSIK